MQTMLINQYGTTGAATAAHFSAKYLTTNASTHYSLQNESDVDGEKFFFMEMATDDVRNT